MKRIIAFTLALLLLLSLAACGKKETEPTVVTEPVTEATEAPVETTEATQPAPTEPEWESGISRAAYGEALYTLLEKGSEVKVIGVFRDYFILSGEEVDLVVEQRFVRLGSEEAFESWEGYAVSGAKVFASVYQTGEALAELKLNTRVSVVEGKGDWLYIKWDGGEGYVSADQISQWYINSNGGKNNQGSSAPADGTDVPIGSLAARDFDAELILLGAYYGPEMEQKFTEETGVVLAQDTEAYICLLLRDLEVKVTERGEETCTIWLGGDHTAQVARWLLRMEGDEAYTPWKGYISGKTAVYEEYQLRNEVMTLNVNTEVQVIDELPNCYVIEVDGQVCYVALDGVSETKIVNRGGNNNTGTSGDVWTPPAM